MSTRRGGARAVATGVAAGGGAAVDKWWRSSPANRFKVGRGSADDIVSARARVAVQTANNGENGATE